MGNLSQVSITVGPQVRMAHMEQPKLRVEVPDELAERLRAAADALCPGEGTKGVSRVARDAVRRYQRYCDGGSRARAKR